MTTLNEARKAIYDLYVNGQSDFTPGSTLAFDNAPFVEPSVDWARLSVRHNFMTQDTLGTAGNRKFERNGIAILQIFTPYNGGTKDADAYAEKAQEIFEGVSIPNTTIYFTDVIARESGPDDNWYIFVIEANFVYYITK